jgi:hypothetical protein
MVSALSGPAIHLIGFAESLPIPEVCFSLRPTGARLIAFYRDNAPKNFARLSFVQYIPVTAPETSLSRTIDDVQAAIAEFAPTLVAACDDAALLVLSHIPNLASRSIAPVGDACTFAFDKWSQIAAARNSGMATMQSQLVKTEADVTEFPIRPAILKPRAALDICLNGISKGRAFIVKGGFLSQEASAAISKRPYMIQEFKIGDGEGFFGIAHNGHIYAPFGHRRLRMMNPAGSGASACVSRWPEVAEIAAAESLLRISAWSGPFMIESLRDASGKAWFMEFNGRFWGSVALARCCGLNIPRFAFEIASNKKPRIPSHVQQGFARHLGRDLVHLLFVLRGPGREYPPHAWPNRLSTLKEVLSPNHLSSFYNYDASEPFFFLKDSAVALANVILRRDR